MDKIPENSFHILLVDDEPDFLSALAARLEQRGIVCSRAGSGEEALALLEQGEPIDLVVLDLEMARLDGIATLQRLKAGQPLLEVLILTGQATIPSAVAAMKLGAFDYLIKPCALEELLTKATSAVARRRERQRQVLDARSKPFISDQDRADLIKAIIEGKE